MEKSLAGARKRLIAMREHLESMRIEAPNWQIANIIGVPKGTIDSSLYALKKAHANSKEKQGKKAEKRVNV
jgi:transcriptional regulator of aromatic amino acid metabolism